MAAPSPTTTGLPAPLVALSVLPSSLGSHLLPDEEILSLCPSVGLYFGSVKVPDYQDGTVYLTSHRIIYIDATDPRNRSGYLRLAQVKVTEYYAGFFKSSAKIILGVRLDDEETEAKSRAELAKAQDEPSTLTLSLGRLEGNFRQPALSSSPTSSAGQEGVRPSSGVGERWICPVCSFSNISAGADDGVPEICQLCGVKRDPTASTSAPPQPSQLLTAKPSSQSSTAIYPDTGRSHSETSSQPKPTGPEIACPSCTFFNHPSMSRCEICDASLGTEAPPTSQLKLIQKLKPSHIPQGPLHVSPSVKSSAAGPSGEVTVKLSFRKGGDKAFYESLSHAMRKATWKRSERADQAPLPAPSSALTSRRFSGLGPRRPLIGMVTDIDGRSTPNASNDATQSVVGIDGILTAYSSRSAAQTSDLSDALKDLRCLMAKAKQMVDLAESLNAKLTRREAEAAAKSKQAVADRGEEQGDDDTAAAATLIRSSLVRLGLPTPAITKEMARDQDEYYAGLARELGYILLGHSAGATEGLMGKGRVLKKGKEGFTCAPSSQQLDVSDGDASKARGIVSLDEVWAVWNRVRGIALIPPAALLSVAAGNHLNRVTDPPIRLRTLPTSGLKVLHTPRYADDTFAARTLKLLRAKEDEDRWAAEQRGQSSTIQQGAGATAGHLDTSTAFRETFYGHGLSTLSVARLEGLSLLIAQELLESAEMLTGALVRDDQQDNASGPSTHWFINRFQELAAI